MSEREYIEQVVKNAVQIGKFPETYFQQVVAEYMVGELDGSTPGIIECVIQEEIGRRATTPRHSSHAISIR